MADLWKWLWCSWAHDDRCYPDVGGLGPKGPWHCARCHPCGEGLAALRSSKSGEGK